MEKSSKLSSNFPGAIKSTRALMAHLADHGDAGWILDVIDAAARDGSADAQELAAAIHKAAIKAGLR